MQGTKPAKPTPQITFGIMATPPSLRTEFLFSYCWTLEDGLILATLSPPLLVLDVD